VNNYRILIITVIGLGISQIIASCHVYMANIQLADQIIYLQSQGYFIVPNMHVLPQLKSLDYAFIGGLFFTGTIGLGIISITVFVSWFWNDIIQKNKIFLIIIILQWMIAVYYANINGWCVFSLYLCIMLPLLAVITAFLPIKSKSSISHPKLFWWLPILFIMMTVVCTGRSITFISIRDNLLLSNDLGNRLNDLYYRYTLFPGEIIKPFALKQQKTCYIDTETNDAKIYIKALKRKCIQYDYLPIPDKSKADVILQIRPPNLFLQTKDRTVVQEDIMIFLRKTKSVFSNFSMQTDVNDLFRMCILLSLVLSAPILTYIIFMNGLFSLFRLIRIPGLISQFLAVGVMCTWIGLIILQLPPEIPENTPEKDWQTAFDQSFQEMDWQQAVVVLKSNHLTLNRKNHQLAQKWLNQTDHPVLKYWLIRYLSDSKFLINNAVFLKYLSDSNVNVVCQALYSLGRQRDQELIAPIKTFMKDCSHWYVQMYAYRALKRLGWRNYPETTRKVSTVTIQQNHYIPSAQE